MEDIVGKLQREKVLGDSHRDFEAMRAKGLWLDFSPRVVAETNLSRANMTPLTDKEKTLFSGDTGR